MLTPAAVRNLGLAASAACLLLVACGAQPTNWQERAAAAAGGVGARGSAALRPLPAWYSDPGIKAINYSAYRAGGPAAGEVPGDADVLQDLSLLHAAGYTLLRLFGADEVSDKILRLAAVHYPGMRFQQGLFLRGPTPASCEDEVNSAQVATAIRLANQYPSVITVSVGNETSFAANQRISCLLAYVKTVRRHVTQPVTADDDYTFFRGSTPGYPPDTILAAIDFVSIHSYPLSNPDRWDWRQAGAPPGTGRTVAMLRAAFAEIRANYADVYNYRYRGRDGSMVTVGESLPIVIGETGWKAFQTNSPSLIEAREASPGNARWYKELLDSWEGTAGGPSRIFYFEAFDEAWKGNDDGWGLWDAERRPRPALCGTPAGEPCSEPQPPGLTSSFSSSSRDLPRVSGRTGRMRARPSMANTP